MNVVIVEDERPAAERLRHAISDYDASVEVIAHLQTVAETVRWFAAHPDPDLLFLDVRLTDGLSLEILQAAEISCPVVFTTAYDAYILDAFECNSIDYLLKPVKPERLARTFEKYHLLRRHFGGELADKVRLALTDTPARKKRLVVQRGTSFVSLDVHRIRYAVSEHKTTFLVDGAGTRYLCEAALTALEDVLDPDAFFRLNRRYLAWIGAVASFRPISRGRISVDLDPPVGSPVIVSQAKARRFRRWVDR